MSDRIALTLSPTGANPAGTTRLPAEVSPEVIEAHVRSAHRLRSHAMACLARQAWSWLTGRVAARRAGSCLDADWLRPHGAR